MRYISENPEFFYSLRMEVENYFQQRKLKKSGNWRLYIRTTVLLVLFVCLIPAPYFLELPPVGHFLLYLLLGLNIAAIGFGIAHDAVHGSFSSRQTANRIFSYTFEALGVSSMLWQSKHNIAHHTYTNVIGMDDDTNTSGIFRFSPEQKWRWWHKFQVFYALPAYSLLYAEWVFVKDFMKWKSKKVGTTKIPELGAKDIISILASKLVHIGLFWVLPFFFFGIGEVLMANLGLYVACGITITIIFQLAHVQRKSYFPVPDKKTGDIMNDWAIEQIRTTANFATWNKLVTAFTGGLNFQIEHHLFPRISHVHYPAVRKIVKQKCKEYGIVYNEYKTMVGAIMDHWAYLWSMGRRPMVNSLKNHTS